MRPFLFAPDAITAGKVISIKKIWYNYHPLLTKLGLYKLVLSHFLSVARKTI